MRSKMTAQEEQVISACPLQAGPMYTTLRDLALSVEWSELRVLELPNTGWAIILGHKRLEDPIRAVLPLPLHTTQLHPSSLKSIFSALESLDTSALPPILPPYVKDIEETRKRARRKPQHHTMGLYTEDTERTADHELLDEKTGNEEIERDMIYIAIVTSDSTVVYYRLTKGIKKPTDIPDE